MTEELNVEKMMEEIQKPDFTISEEKEQELANILEYNFSKLVDSTIFYPDGFIALKAGPFRERPFSFAFTEVDEEGNRGVTIAMKNKEDEKMVDEEEFITIARELFRNIFTKELMEALGG
jgi:hypothetical protein